MQALLSPIQQEADQIFPEVVSIRRHLHQYPELSYEEKETSRYVAQRLQQWEILHRTGIAGYGLVAEIGPANKPVVALRADMDALPILEANEVPYKSRNEGVMHACGHDVHTASLLGTAYILKQLEDRLPVRFRLLFQPAEERFPGGASLMIKEGVLENPRPKSIFGQHVHPPLEAGKVGFCPGQYMASADELYVTVKGRGGHAALPQDCIDPIVIAAHILTGLQQICSRNASPFIPSVLTFGKIYSEGGATNVIPNEVKLMGTFRTMDEAWRAEAHERMQRMAEQMALGMGGACEFKIVKGYPSVYNDEVLTARSFNWARSYLGDANVVELSPRMTAEDFSYYSHYMPGCFYRLGTGNPQKGITSPVHTTTFDIDEEALRISTGLMAWLAICEGLN